MRIHLLVNHRREDALEAAHSAAGWLKNRGVMVASDRDSAAQLKLPIAEPHDFGNADLVVSFGGDGTLIRAAHFCSERGTPILGVYYGRFGFVTQCVNDELGACLSGSKFRICLNC